MFHSVDDGKGNRRVFVNGNLIKHVVWANEEKGLVCYFPYPFKVNKTNDQVYTSLLRGQVTVEFMNETTNTQAETTGTENTKAE